MAQRFRGESQQKVDGKGRVSIPAAFRRVIEAGDPEWKEGLRPNLVIVFGTDRQRHLECYTIRGIEEIERRIERMPLGSRDRVMMERIYQTYVHHAQLDDDGRVVLPQKIRDKIALGDEAYFAGAGDHFDLWAPETWAAKVRAEEEAWFADRPEDFDPRILLPGLPEGA